MNLMKRNSRMKWLRLLFLSLLLAALNVAATAAGLAAYLNDVATTKHATYGVYVLALYPNSTCTAGTGVYNATGVYSVATFSGTSASTLSSLVAYATLWNALAAAKSSYRPSAIGSVQIALTTPAPGTTNPSSLFCTGSCNSLASLTSAALLTNDAAGTSTCVTASCVDSQASCSFGSAQLYYNN